MKKPIALLVVLAAVVAVAVVTAAPASAQTMDLTTPASSPLWWTLTDEITPQELRRRLRDEKDHQARYLEAVERGLAPAVPAEQLSTLAWYENGELWPQLIPLYVAFDALALNTLHEDPDPNWTLDMFGEGLIAHGATTLEAEKIVAALVRYWPEERRLTEEIAVGSSAFVAIMRKANERAGKNLFIEARDNPATADKIADLAGQSRERVRELYVQWRRIATAEAAEPALRRLRQDVSPAAWRALQTYLRTIVAPHLRAIDFVTEELNP